MAKGEKREGVSIALRKKTAVAVKDELSKIWIEVAQSGARRLMADQRRDVLAGFIFSYWALRGGNTRAIFDDKRARRIVERLKENDEDVDELLYAVDGAGKDTWISGKSPDAPRAFNGIETIFRDRAMVERLSQQVPAFRANKPHPMRKKYQEQIDKLKNL